MSTPYFKFDGGFIMVPWDQFDEAAEWYREHMGWKLKGTGTGPVGRKAFFKMPDGTLTADIKTFGDVRITLSEDRKFEGKYPE